MKKKSYKFKVFKTHPKFDNGIVFKKHKPRMTIEEILKSMRPVWIKDRFFYRAV